MGIILLQGDRVSETNEFDDELNFVFSPRLLEKLDGKHGVTKEEVIECIYNSDDDNDLEDTREKHKTTPPTQWCLAYTNKGRLLKIVFVYREENETFYIKTAYEPNDDERRIFYHQTGKRY